MKPNIDIDRISLEERIENLENRTPPPFPGGSSTPDFLLDPRVIDQCKPNGVTDVGNGYVLCMSKDNMDTPPYPIPSSPPWGINIKTATFFPKIYGEVIYPTCAWVRIQSTKTQSILGSFYQDIDIDLSPLADVLKLQLDTTIYSTILLYERLGTVSFFAPNTTTPVTWPALGGNTSINLQINPKASGKYQLGFITPAQNISTSKITIGPCYSFGCYKSILSAFGWSQAQGNTCIGTAQQGKYTNPGARTVSTLADLPGYLKTLYPPSWTR